ncbi:MAG TPA: hypothetical protein VEA80_14395 [Vitreimonas sp.]|uniref:hypothetical protein n=1 Tax=Vitreimonas sp. TaxID=3069702 RepID=UPI002D6B960C|nr:hypothetical protein [Vitreimonas sp.]HYD88661.1 hypothetical protein [Vitreimonas sp.]
MTETRYRLHLSVRGETIVREIVLDSSEPTKDILNWLEDEYAFHANLKKVYLLRADGVEEQIY